MIEIAVECLFFNINVFIRIEIFLSIALFHNNNNKALAKLKPEEKNSPASEMTQDIEEGQKKRQRL